MIVIRRYQAIAVALLLAVTAAGAAFAGDIYKWTDEEGNVHFGDHPGGAEPVRLDIKSRPTDPARIQAMAETGAAARAKTAEEKAAAKADAPTDEEIQAQADEHTQECSKYESQLQEYMAARRIYRDDESGERVFLDEEEMQATRERAEKQVREFCS
jgi:hypothetical protein